MSRQARVAVVGHVEWVTHALGPLPEEGGIAVLDDPVDEPGGAGGVSAAQVAKLGARCRFFTALCDDDAGRAAERILGRVGVYVAAARRTGVQRRALSVVAPGRHDRTIFVVGPPQYPRADDALPWDEMDDTDAVYLTGDDPATIVEARRARVVVAAARRLEALVASGVRADVIVGSGTDPVERVRLQDLPVAPGALVLTEGGHGGRILRPGMPEERFAAATPPGPPVDAYGCGDSFAAGFTVGLARGLPLAAAAALGARCGAACLTARGGLAGQLTEP